MHKMRGGAISNNYSIRDGGAIYNNGTMTINGGEISANTAGLNGSGRGGDVTFMIPVPAPEYADDITITASALSYAYTSVISCILSSVPNRSLTGSITAFRRATWTG